MKYYLETQRPDEDYQPLQIGTLRSAFFLLAVGLLVSTIVFIFEVLCYRNKSKQQQWIPRHKLIQKGHRRHVERMNEHEIREIQQRERYRLKQKRERQYQQMRQSIAPKFGKPVQISPSVYLP